MATKFYLVNNWENCYNVYLTREKAEKAVKILKAKTKKHYTEEELNEHYYITEIKEGEGFGPDVCVNGESNVMID